MTSNTAQTVNTAANGLPLLYSFRRCPYAMRARLAIKAAGTPVELREVVLRHKPAALIAASPKATVPVLVLPDGTVIEQSLDVMHWALAKHDPQGWVRPEEADAVRSLIEANDGPFKQLLDRYKYAPRHPERSADDYRDEAFEHFLAPLNARLQRHGFLLRDTPSLADMALLPFVRQFAQVDAAWFAAAPCEPLRTWLAAFTASPLFDAVMPKFAAWQPGDSATVF